MTVVDGEGADILPETPAYPVHPPGTQLHNWSCNLAKGAQSCVPQRSRSCSVRRRHCARQAAFREVRKFGLDCMATIASRNLDHENVTLARLGDALHGRANVRACHEPG